MGESNGDDDVGCVFSLAMDVGVLCVSFSIGEIAGPAWGWLVFGVMLIVAAAWRWRS